MEKRQKTALQSGVLIVIVAAILVAVNALSALGVYVRKDVTKTEKFTLSKGSGNLLRSMKQPIEVDAYVTDQQDRFVRDLKKEDFQVLEDRRPQTITAFTLVDIPVERATRPLFAAQAIEPDVRTNAQAFDAQWREHGHMERAVSLIAAWCKKQPIAGMTVEVHRLENRTPLIVMEIPASPGAAPKDTVAHEATAEELARDGVTAKS